MLKKIDKLVMRAYIGPFFLTFAVVLFMFLVQYMIKNFKHFVGKDIELAVFAELFGYFSLVMTPIALPLAVLLSSLMTFGSLGQHSELTAIKSAGISLPRILRPATIFILFITAGAFLFNNYVVPFANLKAYSLLWDIKQTKPTLNLQEGVFYDGMEKYRIKVDKKVKDSDLLEGVMIYNHKKNKGNTELVIAKSGRMKNLGNKFLMMELYEGNTYSEVAAYREIRKGEEYVTNNFDTATFLFSMDEFEMPNTDERLFGSHNLMKNIAELNYEKDSVQEAYLETVETTPGRIRKQYFYQKEESEQEKKQAHTTHTDVPFQFANFQQKAASNVSVDSIPLRPLYDMRLTEAVSALNRASNMKRLVDQSSYRMHNMNRQLIDYNLHIHRKFVQSIAVLLMFLIGAPLGAIIKRGGLGVPVLVSIIFFVIYYVMTIMGDKFAKESVVTPEVGSWAANGMLLLFGIFFLNQAYKDARLFDLDYYKIVFAGIFGKK